MWTAFIRAEPVALARQSHMCDVCGESEPLVLHIPRIILNFDQILSEWWGTQVAGFPLLTRTYRKPYNRSEEIHEAGRVEDCIHRLLFVRTTVSL